MDIGRWIPEEIRAEQMRSNLARSNVMPNKPRMFVPGVSLHVRQRGNNRCAVFGDEEDYALFLLMLQSATQRYGVAVHGFTLMTTHTHLLVTPSTELGPSKAMHQLGVRYVLYFNSKYERVGTLWTGRYLAKPINDEKYWLSCLRYIELNPARAKLVVQPEQYRWSSYAAHALGQPMKWLASHPVLEALGANDAERQSAYRALCANPMSTAEIVRHRFKD